MQRDNPAIPVITETARAVFTITDTKLCILVVALKNRDKTMKKLESGFKPSGSWNRYLTVVTRKITIINLII